METFALHLLKSVIWLSGFALVFLFFLRNERFFFLNRLYLVTGILTSLLFPFISMHYTVVVPVITNIQTDVKEFQAVSINTTFDFGLLLLALYLSGVLFVAIKKIKQSKSVFKVIKQAEIIASHPIKLIRTAEYPSSFSFFSYVFVNPSITDVETKEILNHEMVHIRQKHWFDLLLAELLCMLQWFNPFAWIYVRFIRQNHEYLADMVALQRTADPAIYKAALLNQIVGSPVVSLANSFNYSLNKKRFNMMKNIISSPYRKLKILLILPVFGIVLYSFAKPEYIYTYADKNTGNNNPVFSDQTKEVKGVVIQQDGKPLPGASILVKGTTIGVSSDAKGNFKLPGLPDDAVLIVTYVGFKSKVIKPVFTSEMTINMLRDTIKYSNANIGTPPPPPPPPPPPTPMDNIENSNTPPPPPPPPPMDNIENSNTPPPPPPANAFKIRSVNGIPPLFVVDGIITDIEINKISPETIESVRVYKSAGAISKYGEKGKDGVIEITTKKNYSTGNATGADRSSDEKKIIIETMPEFPGGKDAMAAWISNNLKYPGEAVNKKITGRVDVGFMISSTGKVKDIIVSKSVHPLLDDEARRVIGSMPDWKPGMQAGNPVDVYIMVPIEFKLQ